MKFSTTFILLGSFWIQGAVGSDPDGGLCRQEISDGDLAVGVSAFDDPSCSELIGVGCFIPREGLVCRHCQAFQTDESNHLNLCPFDTNQANCESSYCQGGTVGNCFNDQTHECVRGYPNGTCPESHSQCSKLLFFEDFETFDLSVWKHDITMSGGGNWEFQLYRNNRTNSFVQDGSLHIRPSLTEEWLPGLGSLSLHGLTDASACTSDAFYGCYRDNANVITSAKITTAKSFSFKSGRLEVRAKLPRGDWLWPAIWLLPKYENYGPWPASGEIDVMEATGNAPGYAGDRGVDSLISILHWGVGADQNQAFRTTAGYTLESSDFTEDYHIFGLVRHEGGLYTYVDDDSNRVLEVDWTSQSFFERGQWDSEVYANPWVATGANGTPFVNEEFYLNINVAVGGVSDFFPDGEGGKPWSDDSPTAMSDFWAQKDQWYPTWGENPDFMIDWVKVTSIP